jgi:2-iminobutanoate/2-iminopropanoate deaminase
VRSGDLVFASCQIGLDPATGALVGDDVRSQTKQILQNLAGVLEAAGSGLSGVLRTTVYLTRMATFAEMNDVYAGCFAPHRPARSTMEVAALPLGAQVGIDAIAIAGRESTP